MFSSSLLLLSGQKTNHNSSCPTPRKKSPNPNTLPPSQENLIQICRVYVFWPDLKCSETNGRNFIAFNASSGFWVKSAGLNESFISMISALQQMIKIQSLSFVLKFPRFMGFVWFHLSVQQTAWHITVCFWWFDLSFGRPLRHFSFQMSSFTVRCSIPQSWLRPWEQSKAVDFNFELQLLLSKFTALSMDFIFTALSQHQELH